MEWTNMKDKEPPSFGDYLVVINSKHFGKRMTIKCWYGHPSDPFNDNPSKEWLVDEDEWVSYWSTLPDYPTEKY